MDILRTFSRHPILLPYHLGKKFQGEDQTLEQSTHSITQRLRQMLNDGYLFRDDENYPRVWRISNKGLAYIGRTENAPTVFPAVSTRSHLLKIATVAILFGMQHDPEFDVRQGVLTDAPKMFVTEKHFMDAGKLFDSAAVKQNWENEIAELIATPDFPCTPAGNRLSDMDKYFTNLSPEKLAERKAKLSEWELEQMPKIASVWKQGRDGDGYFHLIEHQGKNWGKAHRPDGWICLPNIVDKDGVVRGGDFAVEVEHSPKSNLKEQCRILMQLWDHPKADGCIYFVKEGRDRKMIKRAITDLKNRRWEPKTPGKKPIDEYFILLEQPFLNKHLHPGGLYG